MGDWRLESCNRIAEEIENILNSHKGPFNQNQLATLEQKFVGGFKELLSVPDSPKKKQDLDYFGFFMHGALNFLEYEKRIPEGMVKKCPWDQAIFYKCEQLEKGYKGLLARIFGLTKRQERRIEREKEEYFLERVKEYVQMA